MGDYLRGRLDRPTPRIGAGLALRGLASAAIDLSDGLIADLGHILERSAVGARVEVARLPLSAALQQAVPAAEERYRYALGAGDDYELCFTVPAAAQTAVEAVCADLECGCRCIGVIEMQPGLRLVAPDGSLLHPTHQGFDHFAVDGADQ